MSSPVWYNERVSEELSRKIASVICQRLRDPRIPQVVSVTGIELASDTRNATVSVSMFGEDNIMQDALKALNHAAPYIQRVVAGSMSIRHFPKLYFKLDKSIEHSQRINVLLEEIKDDLEQA
jgi:ribosome-binding factor A